MKCQVRRELKNDIPDTDYSIGYFEGKHSTKRWLLEDEDIDHLYGNHKSGEIHLWCEVEKEVAPKKTEGGSKREYKEARVDEAYEVLLEKHKDKFSTYQYTLWARMLVNKLHHSYDEPPPDEYRQYTYTEKRYSGRSHCRCCDSICQSSGSCTSTFDSSTCTRSDFIPWKVSRYKNEESGAAEVPAPSKILTETEFMEQKAIIMEALRKL
jgi:hypothetical protein